MSIKSGQAVTCRFTTSTADGTATDADSLPTAVLIVNGANNGATVTVTDVGTGRYSATVTLPALAAGDVVEIEIAATIGGVVAVGVVWSAVADTKRVSDLQDLTAGAEMALSSAAVQAVVDAVLDEAHADHNAAGSVGEAIGNAGAASNPWSATDLSEYEPGTAGYQQHWLYQRLQSVAVQLAAATDGGNLTIHRGDTFTAQLSGLGDISTRSKLWFTVKRKPVDPDSQSIIQMEETAQLIYLNAESAATAAHGTITVDDEGEGSMTIALDEAATAALEPRTGLLFDIQLLTSGGDVQTLATGTVRVVADVTRATN